MNGSLEILDVEHIIQLVALAGDPTMDVSLPERKRVLLEGTKKLVDADVYIWSSAVMDPERPGEVGPTCVIDGGWLSDDQRQKAFEALTDPVFASRMIAPMMTAMAEQRCLTQRREDYIDDDEWLRSGEPWRRTGLHHSILMTFPVSKVAFSGIGFHRSENKPPFSVRDKAIVHVIFRQVGWLHRHGIHEPAGETAVSLTPRERQVLLLLLEGDGKKQIAFRMKLSEHTVGDYIKSVYKHFGVHSRSELQSIFLIGSSIST
jgi:DNA-binding CsgD family transcriptional regulator